MADQDHVRLVVSNPNALHTWREQNPGVRLDGSGHRFRPEEPLVQRDLSDAILTHAGLERVDLRWSNLARADLSFANLTEADMYKACLRNACLRHAILMGTNLEDADLRDADLTEAVLGNTRLFNTDLTGATGLSTIHHAKQNQIDADTLSKNAALPGDFLLKCGCALPVRNAISPVAGGLEGDQPAGSGRVLVGLHGIRTHAGWCRALYEVASNDDWQVRMDRWNFGYFSVFRFLAPWARTAKVRWFREAYREEVKDKDVALAQGQHPSIVAHSFGTYILGNALLKYDWLKFNKVILCGSILPQDFPWDKLIARGQVQAVRNEFGVKDIWTAMVRWFVAGTGPSGHQGFTCSHERFEQEEFVYKHSEYFNKGHMEAKWLPFLDRGLPEISATDTPVQRSRVSRPWGLHLLYLIALILLILAGFWFSQHVTSGTPGLIPQTTELGPLTWTEVKYPLPPGGYPEPLKLVDDVLRGDQYPGGSILRAKVKQIREANGYDPPHVQWKAFQSSSFGPDKAPDTISVKPGVNVLITLYVFTEANGRWRIHRIPQEGDDGKAVRLDLGGQGSQPCRLLLFAFPLDAGAYESVKKGIDSFVEVKPSS